MVDNKQFKKRSASFYPPGHPSNPKPGNWYLRHVAFLGAQPPAIAGLADFADTGAEGAVSFSEGEVATAATPVISQPLITPVTTPEQTQMDKDLQAQLDAAKAKQIETDAALATANKAAETATAQLAQFAETAKRDRTAGYVSFAEAQIKAGVLLPKEKDAAVAVLDALADSQPVSFAEGGATKTVPPAEWLKTFISSRVPVVSFGEHAAGNGGNQPGQAANTMTDAEIDAKAQAYARQHKVNYAEALSAVVTFTA
jgi:hypothetical protein